MFTSEMLRLFPRRRIKPIDGMAVTADVWEEAHEYHRQLNRFHALLMHGAGVVTGLEVIASDPADSAVYILPGIAQDSIGQTIVLPEPRAYDLGNSQGLFYLIVSYNESRPQVEGGRADEDTPRYVHEQFLLEAVAELPQTPHVELARVQRRGRDEAIRNARHPKHPRANEIDLRFRREIGVQELKSTAVGVVILPGVGQEGDETIRRHREGMDNVGQGLQHTTNRRVWVDTQTALNRPLENFDLLYLVGCDAFTLDAEQMNALYAFLQGGGTIFYESCRQHVGQDEPGGDAAFRDLLGSLGIELQPVDAQHALLRQPHLFGQLPDGFETRGAPVVEMGGGVVFSTFDFGCLWAGARRGRPATRSEIRNALEWAENVLDFALARRENARRNGGHFEEEEGAQEAAFGDESGSVN